MHRTIRRATHSTLDQSQIFSISLRGIHFCTVHRADAFRYNVRACLDLFLLLLVQSQSIYLNYY